ncbi:hypothetical protein OHA72_58360 [Dactylosporangium sp. NBC_01737]|uniref:hypothetical protein n=1 Tax=Dactylosporangium sp. NBC_01737 TaxID=2975959 RepID=UPI002E0FADFE|nr:hypothetical protein OHA72_58360 [Dactylosporangium sp. NBC_01737]
MSTSSIPFRLRSAAGTVEAGLVRNNHPVELGCGLLDASVPAAAASGFPVCTARVQHPAQGYAAACGWIQFVRSTDGGPGFALDPLALFRGIDTPYAFFGIRPIFFDAPFRAGAEDLDWLAYTFLCFSPDAVMSRRVHAAIGFSWGFQRRDGQFTFIHPVHVAPAAWDERLPLLRATFPSWTFASGFRED